MIITELLDVTERLDDLPSEPWPQLFYMVMVKQTTSSEFLFFIPTVSPADRSVTKQR